MLKSYEEFMEAKRSGYLNNMRISSSGSISLDSDQVLRSDRVKDDVRYIKDSLAKMKRK